MMSAFTASSYSTSLVQNSSTWSHQFAQTSGATMSKPSWTRRFTSPILYVVLFFATWPLTRAHTSSIGLSSQWPAGERRTWTPCSAAGSSTIYFGCGLCCFTSMYNTDLRAVGVLGMFLSHSHSRISPLLEAEVGAIVSSVLWLWYGALSKTTTEAGGKLGSS